jgi:hypothetical protein
MSSIATSYSGGPEFEATFRRLAITPFEGFLIPSREVTGYYLKVGHAPMSAYLDGRNSHCIRNFASFHCGPYSLLIRMVVASFTDRSLYRRQNVWWQNSGSWLCSAWCIPVDVDGFTIPRLSSANKVSHNLEGFATMLVELSVHTGKSHSESLAAWDSERLIWTHLKMNLLSPPSGSKWR